MTNQQAPESLDDPSPDQLRAIARTARNSSGSASDDCGPLAYVLHGWRAAAIAFRAQQAALVEALQPAPSAAAAVVVYEQKENEMQVWFRPARMHGHPERTPIKATITKDRGNGIVDLTYDDGEFSGNARAVPNALRLPRNVREQVAVWWDVGFEMDFQTAVDNSLKKKKDDPPPQPSPTPQADSQPAPVVNQESVNLSDKAACASPVIDKPASAPADSVTAPEGPTNAQIDACARSMLYQPWGIGSRIEDAREFAKRVLSKFAPPAQAADGVLEDAARLDWLEQNIFNREMSEWDAKFGGRCNQNMWVLFAPKGVQGSARKIIDAARKQGANHD